MTIRAGVAVHDITPPLGTPMSGYAARTESAAGVRDPLTVRVLAVDDTVLVTVDVVGLHEDLCETVRRRCAVAAAHVVVHATHTHSGPSCTPGRLGDDADEAWLDHLVTACMQTIDRAVAAREPVRIKAGYGDDPDVARNRRRSGGPVDRALPVVRFDRPDGSVLAILTSYACHPVVLGADNPLFSGDYPAEVRHQLERELGGTALFATGCAGDANTGHFPSDSFAADPSGARTFEERDRVGAVVTRAVESARLSMGDECVSAASTTLPLDIDLPDRAQVRRDAQRWAVDAESADPRMAALLTAWTRWANDLPVDPPGSWEGSVTVLRWGPAVLVALPGEPFAGIGMQIRHELEHRGVGVVLVIGYANGTPGYVPTRDEYAHGGYEVDDAHRYYGMPGPFARDSAERLVESALETATEVGLVPGH